MALLVLPAASVIVCPRAMASRVETIAANDVNAPERLRIASASARLPINETIRRARVAASGSTWLASSRLDKVTNAAVRVRKTSGLAVLLAKWATDCASGATSLGGTLPASEAKAPDKAPRASAPLGLPISGTSCRANAVGVFLRLLGWQPASQRDKRSGKIAKDIGIGCLAGQLDDWPSKVRGVLAGRGGREFAGQGCKSFCQESEHVGISRLAGKLADGSRQIGSRAWPENIPARIE